MHRHIDIDPRSKVKVTEVDRSKSQKWHFHHILGHYNLISWITDFSDLGGRGEGGKGRGRSLTHAKIAFSAAED